MIEETFPRPVVCLLVERLTASGEHEILIQRRTKKRDVVAYLGVWELPQGKIRTGESIQTAANRELLEETKLRVTRLRPEHSLDECQILDSTICTFYPLIVSIDMDKHFIGFGVVVDFRGEVSETEEASHHRWIDREEARRLLQDEEVFPLNVPLIKKYFAI